MKEVISIYRKHKSTVDEFLVTLIKNLPQDYIQNADKILKENKMIQLLYAVDNNYIQISPTICKKKHDPESKGSQKSHYFSKVAVDARGFYISNPYIHHRTGRASLSMVHKIGEIYYVFDINMIDLLEELRLIEYNGVYDKIKRTIYFVGAFFLAVVAIALILYGGYEFGIILFGDSETDLLHNIFQSIIAITLGIAIYDLSSQIFEHEVLFRTFHHEEDRQYKILGKFLISIIIALSIETLMVVFKIALDDPSQMLSAFWLLLGTTLMFVGLAYFYKTIKQSSRKEEE
ncbi:MAG: hypothetical protein JXQ77_05695 [Campylobacterales bacterium]|nr:hypothetical protein [Campylobacterales bacterium]